MDTVAQMAQAQEAINCSVIAGVETQKQLAQNASRCALNVNESVSLYKRFKLKDDNGVNAVLDSLNKEISAQDTLHKRSLTTSSALVKQLAKGTPIVGLKRHIGYFAVTVDGIRSARTADQGRLKRYYDSKNAVQLAHNRAAVVAEMPTDGVLFVMKVTAEYLDDGVTTGEYSARIKAYDEAGERVKPTFLWFDAMTETAGEKQYVTAEGKVKIDGWLKELYDGGSTSIIATDAATPKVLTVEEWEAADYALMTEWETASIGDASEEVLSEIQARMDAFLEANPKPEAVTVSA